MTSIAKVYAELSMLVKQPNIWLKKQTFSGYTNLGGVPVKLLKLTGTTDAVAGMTASVAHGLTASKILSVSAQVTAGGTIYMPGDMAATEAFAVTADATNINVINGPLAVTTLAQPFTILIIHEE